MNADYLRLLLSTENSVKLGCFKNFADGLREQQLFITTEANIIQRDIIPVLNAYINGIREKRSVGLILLRRILPQCPSDIFIDNASTWMQQCCKWDEETVKEELKILDLLIMNSSSYPDIRKQVIASFLPRFVDRLMNHPKNENATIMKWKLRCLKRIIDHYSSSCGPHKHEFCKFVILCMKEFPKQKTVIREAALCFVSLCQCSNKGLQGISQKDLWTNQLNELIDTCQKLFDLVYSCVDVVSMHPKKTTEIRGSALLKILEEVSEDPVSRFHSWKESFVILSELLQSMFLCKFPVHKSFRPDDVFSLIRRVLAVNGNTLKNCSPTNDIYSLNAVLPDIHVSIFAILRTLIRTAKRDLISYGSLICKLCLQSLKWTQSKGLKYATIEPFETLRCKVYIVLSDWMSIAGNSSSIEIFADEIIPLTILNIEFLKPEISLKATNPCKKGKRKKQEQNSIQNLDSTWIIDIAVNKNTCLVAHKMLQSLIRYNHSLIKWEHHKTLQRTVISSLLPIVGSNTATCYPLPYSNVKCRSQLFATLYTLTKWPHWKWKALVSLSNRILSVGRNDGFEVSSFCALALTELEGLAHPRGPSLDLSVNGENIRSSAQDSAPCGAAFTSQIDSTMNSVCRSSDAMDSDVVDEDRTRTDTSFADEPVDHRMKTSEAAESVHSPLPSSARANVGATFRSSSRLIESDLSSHPTADVISPQENERERFRPVAEYSAFSEEIKVDSRVTKSTRDFVVASMLSDFVDTLE